LNAARGRKGAILFQADMHRATVSVKERRDWKGISSQPVFINNSKQ
jgi:hypothetical protein